jgi:hypothetical protein
MKGSEEQSQPDTPADHLASFSKERRALIGGLASIGVGLAGLLIAPANIRALSSGAAPSSSKLAAVPCGRSTVIASDSETVAETDAGKIRGYKRNGIYIFKGVPYGASTSGARRFRPPAVPSSSIITARALRRASLYRSR